MEVINNHSIAGGVERFKFKTDGFNETMYYGGLFRDTASVKEMIEHMESIIPETHQKFVEWILVQKCSGLINGGMRWQYIKEEV